MNGDQKPRAKKALRDSGDGPKSRAVPSFLKAVRGERVYALRKALELSQDAVAAGSGGDLDRTAIIHMEKGRTAVGSLRMLRGLARGLNVSMDVLDVYLDGKVPLTEVVARRNRGQGYGLIDWFRDQPIPLTGKDESDH